MLSPKVSDEHKETRSKAILHAARHVFSKKGYVSTTMKDVVEESGMSRGSVYMYFSSTQEMMFALIGQEDEENMDQVDKLIERSESIWLFLVSLLHESEASITEMSSEFAVAIYEFYLTQWRLTGTVPFLEQRYDKAIAIWSSLLQIGIDRGEFQPLAPNADIARVIISLTDGLTLDCAYLGSNRIKLGAQLDVSIKMLQSILQPQSISIIDEGVEH
ncbi:MAG: TetR family transcriptional regulator [Gorillibacterium sp.]|nr:TetR family transcriptional regulator [Gorillibacterium sp.]